jgi:4'-phosphopantetheinyl transferase EntD
LNRKLVFGPLLPKSIFIAEMAPSAGTGFLFTAEEEFLRRSVEKRRREFATGRQLARTLLVEAVGQAGPLLPDSDGVPRWPKGIVGSITHCSSLCAVALARVEEYVGLGLDVEPALPIESNLLPLILSGVERERWKRLPPSLHSIGGRLAFTIKEAVYKSIFPISRVFLDFLQVEITLEGDGRFKANVLLSGAAPPGYETVNGYFRVAEGHIAAAVVLPTRR